MSNRIFYPTSDGYSTAKDSLFVVYQTEVKDGIIFERIKDVFTGEADAIACARNISPFGEGVRVSEVFSPEAK